METAEHNPEDVSQHPKPKGPSTSRPMGKIASLPTHVRTEINYKLREGWRMHTICDWLFAQKADLDIPDLDIKTGDPYSRVWTRTAGNERIAEENCKTAISRWYRTHYHAWLKKEIETDQTIRLVDRVEQLTSLVIEKDQGTFKRAGSFLIRSLFIDAIEKVRTNNNDPDQLIRLAQAWSRLK